MMHAQNSKTENIPAYIEKEFFMRDGLIHVSLDGLENNRFDISDNNFWVTYWNVREFGDIDGDNFTFEARFKNGIDEGGLTGQYALITIMCENGRTVVPLSSAGTVSNIYLKLQEKVMQGRDNDLSVFGTDMNSWNSLRCTIRDKNAIIDLNGEHIYDASYERTAGRIIGVNFSFYGCGSVDYVRLSDLNGNTAFEDDF